MGIYMNTSVHFSSYLTQFFLEWEMLQTKVVEKIETHVMLNNNFFFFTHVIYEIM